jgi:pilus assembly protein Flp/PilA
VLSLLLHSHREGGASVVVNILRYYLTLLAAKTGRGQGLVEYALVIVLISIAAIAIMTTLGTSVKSVFSKANSSLVAP